jgi:putative glutamine amidotransferase
VELVRRAIEANLPLFAICRGIQVLNVARGGTLIQDIPDEVGTTVEHRIKEPRFAIAHDVWLTSDSLLERTLRERLEDADSCAVNSRHHQAPKDAGEGLAGLGDGARWRDRSARGPKPPVRARRQWHPENFWRTGEFRALFEAFVQACNR